MSEFKRPGHVRISNQFARDPRVSNRAFRLYVFISTFNPSFPSYDIIKKCTGLGRQSISDSIKELVALGWIEYDRGNSKKRANQYKIHTSLETVLVDPNQSSNRTSTSLETVLEPVLKPYSNNTNVIIPIKKGDVFKMVRNLAKDKDIGF